MLDLKVGMWVKLNIPDQQINVRARDLPLEVFSHQPVRITFVNPNGVTNCGVHYPWAIHLQNFPGKPAWNYWGTWDQIWQDNECLMLDEATRHDTGGT